jgi:hypothetical protein
MQNTSTFQGENQWSLGHERKGVSNYARPLCYDHDHFNNTRHFPNENIGNFAEIYPEKTPSLEWHNTFLNLYYFLSNIFPYPTPEDNTQISLTTCECSSMSLLKFGIKKLVVAGT